MADFEEFLDEDDQERRAAAEEASGISGGYAWAPVMKKIISEKREMLTGELAFVEQEKEDLFAEIDGALRDESSIRTYTGRPSLRLQLCSTKRNGGSSVWLRMEGGLPKAPVGLPWAQMREKVLHSAKGAVEVLKGVRGTQMWLVFCYAGSIFENGGRLLPPISANFEEPKGEDVIVLLNNFISFCECPHRRTLLQSMGYRIQIEDPDDGRIVKTIERKLATFTEDWADNCAVVDLSSLHPQRADADLELVRTIEDAVRARAAAKSARAALLPELRSW